MEAKRGGLFTSLTTTVKLFASLNAGEPLSVTRTMTLFVLGPWASLGVQLNTPVVALIVMPAGAPGSRLNVKVFAGTSGSVAVAVNDSVLPSLIVWLTIAASEGAEFTSLTTTLKVFVSLSGGEPLSVTRTVTA